MKKLRVNKVDSPDGETHFILEEFPPTEQHSEYLQDSDLAEIKRISRKDASNRLSLFRKE